MQNLYVLSTWGHHMVYMGSPYMFYINIIACGWLGNYYYIIIIFTIIEVRRVYRHPDFNSSSIDNDIALLRLPALPAYPDPTTGIPTMGVTDRACLPQWNEALPAVGTRCMVMGWGKASTSHSFGTDVLMYTRVSTRVTSV